MQVVIPILNSHYKVIKDFQYQRHELNLVIIHQYLITLYLLNIFFPIF